MRRWLRGVGRLGAAAMGMAPTLDRYVALAALRGYVLVASGLAALFSLLAFVEQLRLVGQGSYRVPDALLYVLLTAPLRLVSVTPVALLVGSLLSLGALGRNSELIALRGLGLSERRIMGAVARLVLPVTLAVFALTQFVVPPAERWAEALRSAALAGSADAPGDHGFWAHGAHTYLHVGRFQGRAEALGIEIYAFAPDGRLLRAIEADSAAIGPGRDWVLLGVRETTVDRARLDTRRIATLDWHAFVSTGHLRMLALPLEAMPPVGLLRHVRALRREHQQGLYYELELWRRIAMPLAMVAMIMAAAPFVFAPPRSQNLGRLITVGALVGVVFTLAQQITAHLALLLGLDPAAAALAPPLVLMALAALALRRRFWG